VVREIERLTARRLSRRSASGLWGQRYKSLGRWMRCSRSLKANKPLKLTVGKRGLPMSSSLRSSAAA
jgi:hypothetical protein